MAQTRTQTDDTPSVAVTKGRARTATAVVPWLPQSRALASLKNEQDSAAAAEQKY